MSAALPFTIPGEEGSPGSFEVVWEAQDWRHTRLLYSRTATGAFPPPGALTRAVMSLLLGWGLAAW